MFTGHHEARRPLRERLGQVQKQSREDHILSCRCCRESRIRCICSRSRRQIQIHDPGCIVGRVLDRNHTRIDEKRLLAVPEGLLPAIRDVVVARPLLQHRLGVLQDPLRRLRGPVLPDGAEALVDVSKDVQTGSRAHTRTQEMFTARAVVARHNLVEDAVRRTMREHDVHVRERRHRVRRLESRDRGRRVEAILVSLVRKCPAAELGRVRGRVEGELRAVAQRERPESFVLEVHDARAPRILAEIQLLDLVDILEAHPMASRSHARVVLGVQRDVVVARDNQLQFGVRLLEHRHHGLVFGLAPNLGQVARVQEDVGFWQGVSICIVRSGRWMR
jgi:hypothetical protein